MNELWHLYETGLIRLNRIFHGLLAGLLCGLLCALAACSGSTQPAASSTPSPTLTAASPTLTLPPGLTPLAFVGNSNISPSPDGTMLAVATKSGATLTIYNLAGQALGHFTASSRHGVYFPSWLPDSSGLFVADLDFNSSASTAPLLIMAPDGSVKPTGLDAGLNDGDAPLVSPDNRWIADAAPAGPNGYSQVEFVPRAGGTKHVVPRTSTTDGDWLLGWRNGQIIYFSTAQYAIYAISPTGGSAQFLTGTPTVTINGVENLKLPLYSDDAGLSPDGQALSLTNLQAGNWVLAGTHLQRDPPTLTDSSIFWVGQGHDVLGPSSHGTLAFIDIFTGAVVHDTGISGADVHAVAGDWAITSADGELHAVNYEKNVDHALGGYQGYAAFALGKSRFLLHQQQAPGDTYIVDPTQLAA